MGALARTKRPGYTPSLAADCSRQRILVSSRTFSRCQNHQMRQKPRRCQNRRSPNAGRCPICPRVLSKVERMRPIPGAHGDVHRSRGEIAICQRARDLGSTLCKLPRVRRRGSEPRGVEGPPDLRNRRVPAGGRGAVPSATLLVRYPGHEYVRTNGSGAPIQTVSCKCLK